MAFMRASSTSADLRLRLVGPSTPNEGCGKSVEIK